MESGKVCGFELESGWFDCVEGVVVDFCEGLDQKGMCDGMILIYCSGGAVVVVDCVVQGKGCGYDAIFDWFDCFDDPDVCMFDCEGKVCGVDGCDGICGICVFG